MKLISQSDESSRHESQRFPRGGCGSSYMRINMRTPILVKSPSHLERLGNPAKANGDEPGFERGSDWLRFVQSL